MAHLEPLIAALASPLSSTRRVYVAASRTAGKTSGSRTVILQAQHPSYRCFSTSRQTSETVSQTIKRILSLSWDQTPSKPSSSSKQPTYKATVQKPTVKKPSVRGFGFRYFDSNTVGFSDSDPNHARQLFKGPGLLRWLGGRPIENTIEVLRRNRWLDFWLCAPPEPEHNIPVAERKEFAYHKKFDTAGMKAYLEFVTVPTADTSGTTLLLHYDSRRYMIGRVAEGTQRGWVERGISMRNIEHVFLTGKTSSENTGGILGMVLTLADILKRNQDPVGSADNGEKRALNIHGGSNLLQTFATARRFIFRKSLPLKIKELKDDPNNVDSGDREPLFADENIRVWPMIIRPEKTVQVESPTFKSRKRTFDQLNGIEPTKDTSDVEKVDTNGADPLTNEAEREARYHDIRQAVVHDMFGSNWSLDCLVETPLREVQPPTKIWIRDATNKGLREYTGPLPGGDVPIPNPDLKVLVRTPWPGALVSALPPTTPKDDAVSYIICPWPRRGKFDVKKAKELGVPAGPIRGRLAQGETITLENGRVITPDMVLGKDQQGHGIAVVDLPTDGYVVPLVNRPEWNSKELMENFAAFVWILGPRVAGNTDLRKFIEDQSERKHIFASPDVCPNELAFESSATSAIHLAQMDIDNFPIPHFDNTTIPQTSFRSQNQESVPKPSSVLPAERGLKFEIEPRFVTEKDGIPNRLDTGGLLSTVQERHVSLAHSALESVSKGEEASKIERWRNSLPKPGPEVEIITLGTGSALPSKYRNVSATLVRVPGNGNYMLDCGENTIGQLQRAFDPDELRDILKNLRMIWISHLHADHHLGTVSLIKAWHSVVHGPNRTTPPMSPNTLKDLQNPAARLLYAQNSDISGPPYLAVISDRHMLHYLSEYSYIEDFGYTHILPLAPVLGASTLHLSHNKCPITPLDYSLLPTLLGVQDIQAVHVDHCRGALAVAITFPPASAGAQPFKLAYSGDARPSQRFAAIGRDATVLVHEATFDDELQVEAYAKKHSTTSEALRVGAEMRARSVVLTHFSQRYQKLPVLDVKNFGSGLEGVVESGEEENEVDAEDEIRDIPETEGGVGEERFVSLTDGSERQPHEGKAGDEFGTSDNPLRHEKDIMSDDILEAAVDDARQDEGKEPARTQWNPMTPASGDLEEKRAKAKDMKVCVAFDYMRVKVGDIPRVAALMPAMMALFDEEKQKELKSAKLAQNAQGHKANGKPKEMSKKHQRKLSRQKSRESIRSSDGVEMVGK